MPAPTSWALAVAASLALSGACDAPRTGKPSSSAAQPQEPTFGAGHDGTSESGAIFTDRARDVGIDFVHVNGMSGGFYMPEILAPGVALFDYDNDGDLDAFIAQGRPLGSGPGSARASTPSEPSPPRRSTLYRNDLAAGADPRALRFTDVTAHSHIDVKDYAMGVAAGDYDNDGCVDLFVTEFGQSQLFRNRCDGTFADVTTTTRLSVSGWAVSASFVDYDRDGWLDLYIGNYVHYVPGTKAECHAPSGEPDYCSPQAFRAQADRLYHNDRNGLFSDVTSTALIGGHFGPALGVTTADFDNDGWPDIFVANDGEANQLWMNRRDGTFRDQALLAGVALGGGGAPEGNMGVDAGDFDGDGDEDLFDTVLPGQGNNLWVNGGAGVFEDSSTRSRIAGPSLALTGFGTAWIDYDNDGWLDLLTVNGAVSLKASRRPDAPPYAESKTLVHNRGDGRFEDVSTQAGHVFGALEVSRGAAFGDVDSDGDTDVLVGNNNGPARLLINHVGSRQHWLGLHLVDEHARPALGARVSVTRADGRRLVRRVRSDGSYASASDPRVLVGLGDSTAPADVEVVWPTGQVERWTDLPVDRYHTRQQGAGR